MATRLYPLARLKARARLAIGLLRGADLPDGELGEAFRTLRASIADAGLTLGDAACRYVSRDELRLLALLAFFQRQSVGVPRGIAQPLRDALRMSAECFDRRVGRLDYHMTVLLDDITFAAPKAGRALDRTATTPFQSRVLRLIATQESVPVATLQNAGISRQTVSAMCKRGLLRRVRMGVYAVTSEARA